MRKHLWLLFAALIPLSLGWLLWSGVPVRTLLDPVGLAIVGVTVLLLLWPTFAKMVRRR
jgi:hypothetical protein